MLSVVPCLVLCHLDTAATVFADYDFKKSVKHIHSVPTSDVVVWQNRLSKSEIVINVEC